MQNFVRFLSNMNTKIATNDLNTNLPNTFKDIEIKSDAGNKLIHSFFNNDALEYL